MATLDDLLASKNPCSNQNVQVLTLHLAAERRKTSDVRDQKPARDILDFAQCSLQQVRFGLPRNGDWLPERQNLISDCDLIAVAYSDWVMNPPLIHESSVAAAEIDQPRFTNILQVNQSVPARHFGRFQHDRVSGGPSERTTATDRMACAIGRFQPGTFLWGDVHAETFYQELSIEATCLKSRGARAGWHEPEQAVVAVAIPAFNLLLRLMMYTCSK